MHEDRVGYCQFDGQVKLRKRKRQPGDEPRPEKVRPNTAYLIFQVRNSCLIVYRYQVMLSACILQYALVASMLARHWPCPCYPLTGCSALEVGAACAPSLVSSSTPLYSCHSLD
jgi:hypothetical protein